MTTQGEPQSEPGTQDTRRAPAATLLQLSDTGQTVADPAEDVRGRTVLDKKGEELGKVDALFVDDREYKVRFLRVASGGFLGLGETTVLVPVDAITRITDDAVHIDTTREHVAGAPAYTPELADDYTYYGGLYSHYGYAPFWGAGYMYPSYPFYDLESQRPSPRRQEAGEQREQR